MNPINLIEAIRFNPFTPYIVLASDTYKSPNSQLNHQVPPLDYSQPRSIRAHTAEANTNPPPDQDGPTYPKPAGWEYMTHEERYATLRSAPKPDSPAFRTAPSHVKQHVLRD